MGTTIDIFYISSCLHRTQGLLNVIAAHAPFMSTFHKLCRVETKTPASLHAGKIRTSNLTVEDIGTNFPWNGCTVQLDGSIWVTRMELLPCILGGSELTKGRGLENCLKLHLGITIFVECPGGSMLQRILL